MWRLGNFENYVSKAGFRELCMNGGLHPFKLRQRTLVHDIARVQRRGRFK
jgi:hypothetical protein